MELSRRQLTPALPGLLLLYLVGLEPAGHLLRVASIRPPVRARLGQTSSMQLNPERAIRTGPLGRAVAAWLAGEKGEGGVITTSAAS